MDSSQAWEFIGKKLIMITEVYKSNVTFSDGVKTNGKRQLPHWKKKKKCIDWKQNYNMLYV